LDIDTKASKSVTRTRIDNPVDQMPNGRVGSAQLDEFTIGHYRAETNPPSRNICPPSEPSYPSTSTSLAAYSLSRLKSTQMGNHYPLSAPPRSNTLLKEDSFDLHTSTVAINQVNRVVVFYLICLASEWVSDWIDCLGVLNIVN